MKNTCLTLFLACSCVGMLHATVVITPGNHPQQPGEVNILGDNNVFGNPIEGHINQAPTVGVDFLGNQTLVFHGGGQAEVTGCTNPTGPCNHTSDLTPINSLTITAENSASEGPLAFTDFIANINVNSDCIAATCANTTASIEAFAPGSTTPEGTLSIMPLVEGQNFFTAVATNGETIGSIVITSSSTTTGDGFFSDLRQPRISDLHGVTLIPEPSTYAPLMAVALASIALLRRRSRKA